MTSAKGVFDRARISHVLPLRSRRGFPSRVLPLQAMTDLSSRPCVFQASKEPLISCGLPRQLRTARSSTYAGTLLGRIGLLALRHRWFMVAHSGLKRSSQGHFAASTDADCVTAFPHPRSEESHSHPSVRARFGEESHHARGSIACSWWVSNPCVRAPRDGQRDRRSTPTPTCDVVPSPVTSATRAWHRERSHATRPPSGTHAWASLVYVNTS